MNLDNLKFLDGDFLTTEKLSDMIYENEGFFTQKDQSMIFDLDGKELMVNYEVYVEGTIEEEYSDFFNPGSCNVELKKVDITINEILIDGELTNLETEDFFKVEVSLKNKL